MAYQSNNRQRRVSPAANTNQAVPNVSPPSPSSPLVLPGQPNPLNKPGLLPLFQYISSIYQQYIKNQVNVGYLKVSVTAAADGKPIQNAQITISKPLGDNYFMAQIVNTDEMGETAPIPLPTRSAELSLTPEYPVPYTVWNLTAEKPGYYKVVIYDIPVFPGVTTTQSISLKTAEGDATTPIEQIYASSKQMPANDSGSPL